MVSVGRVASAAVIAAGGPLFAQSAAITEEASTFSFSMNGAEMIVSRSGLSCPSSCIKPMIAAAGVDTLGELEVIGFMQSSVSAGSGLLIDVRMPATFSSGSLPSAVNVPVATFSPENPYLGDLLSALGVQETGSSRNFDRAFNLAVFGGGPDDCDDAYVWILCLIVGVLPWMIVACACWFAEAANGKEGNVTSLVKYGFVPGVLQ